MKPINLYFLLLLFSALILSPVQAQDAPGRTKTTIVADALAQLPADNPADYQKTMTSLTSAGEEGLLSLIQMLKVPDEPGNEVIEYAISGWTNFVANDAVKRSVAANTFAKALQLPINKEIKAFVIRQLELIADEGQLDALTQFIEDERLSAPAIQVLAAIQSEKANDALLNALIKTTNEQVKINLINGLAYTGFEKAEPVLLDLLQNNPSPQMEEVLLNAIGKVGNYASILPLKAAAEKTGYSYTKNSATASYIQLLRRIAPKHAKAVNKEASQLLSKATKLGLQDVKIASMELLMGPGNTNKTKLLNTALKDGNIDFLTGTLNLYPDADEKSIALVTKKLKSKSTPDEVKIPLVYWLGKNQVETAIPLISQQLQSPDKMLQTAAVKSLTKLGTDAAVQVLTQQFITADKETATQISDELLTVDNKNLAGYLASVYPTSTNEGKLAILSLLSSRQLTEQYPLVYGQFASTDKTIKLQAAKSLAAVSTQDNLPALFNLLETSDPEYVPALQAAVNNAVSYLTPEEQSKLITGKINSTDKKYLYYNALAKIGTPAELDRITGDYKKLSGRDKAAAFDALTNWQTFDAVYALLDILRGGIDKADADKAVNALIPLITQSGKNGEVKALYLRELMQFAQSDSQKNTILKNLGSTNSYKALLFVAPFMDDDALKETAAQTAMNLALNNPMFLDKNTATILDKVSKTLNNPDAGYQREAISKYLNENKVQEGFVPLFNGKDLTGWKGLVRNPIARAKMSTKELEKAQKEADAKAKESWIVENGELLFTGEGDNLCTDKKYEDFELLVDWKLYPGPEPDAGIYLRGTPQVQIWDTASVQVGAQVGSGGLYNNEIYPSKPLKVADEKLGEWNTFRIKMIGDRVTVWLNGELVVNNVIMENYWDRNQPIPSMEQIELQAHGSKVAYRDILIREIPRPEPFKLSAQEVKEGYKILFDGTNMHEWTGNTNDYIIEDGVIAVYPKRELESTTKNLYTKNEYDNFIFRFEFQLTPGANNGLGIRTPMEGDAAYVGMELQILDNEAPIYEKLADYQYHGSVYGIIPAKRGFLKPVGEWNYQEVIANGDNIKITLNGEVILDGNIREAVKNGTMDKKEHPGLFNKKGHIGFLGHDSVVKFRNIRIKELR